jgi:hypothetical protein
MDFPKRVALVWDLCCLEGMKVGFTMDGIPAHFFPIVLTCAMLLAVHGVRGWLRVEDGKCDDATSALLTASSAPDATVPVECRPIVEALEDADPDADEDQCAQQMRDIVAARHLEYSTLIDAPETLLRCSPGMARSNGALWTRFTVQYNLYAGSIVAMGTETQRKELCASQEAGGLGCFAFTEKGAGVLSGAGMETTAIYDRARQVFVINSPTASSCKNWVSPFNLISPCTTPLSNTTSAS